ncbi:MAG TPA: hypothetical protein VKA30_11110 [Actinomycetota bacterium]|nr:hypothetical protein [Actinomycetota bacterium]
MTTLRLKGLPLGCLAAAALVVIVTLLLPVHADFGDDAVLRLQGFDRQRSFLPTSVDCGLATSNLASPTGTRPFYDVARDDACHDRSVRRVWMALASGAVLVAAGLTAAAANLD